MICRSSRNAKLLPVSHSASHKANNVADQVLLVSFVTNYSRSSGRTALTKTWDFVTMIEVKQAYRGLQHA